MSGVIPSGGAWENFCRKDSQAFSLWALQQGHEVGLQSEVGFGFFGEVTQEAVGYSDFGPTLRGGCFVLQYFNHISIEDSRVYELTSKAGLLSPYQILHECLKR